MITTSVEIIAIYGLAALLPVIFLLQYVYRLDSIEKEPSSLLWKLIGGGVFAAIAAMILEFVFVKDIDSSTASLEEILLNAVLVGIFEEVMKFFFLKKEKSFFKVILMIFVKNMVNQLTRSFVKNTRLRREICSQNY